MYWVLMILQRLWMVKLTFKILLHYHIRKSVNKNFSYVVLVMYMHTLESLKVVDKPLMVTNWHSFMLWSHNNNTLYGNFSIKSRLVAAATTVTGKKYNNNKYHIRTNIDKELNLVNWWISK